MARIPTWKKPTVSIKKVKNGYVLNVLTRDSKGHFTKSQIHTTFKNEFQQKEQQSLYEFLDKRVKNPGMQKTILNQTVKNFNKTVVQYNTDDDFYPNSQFVSKSQEVRNKIYKYNENKQIEKYGAKVTFQEDKNDELQVDFYDRNDDYIDQAIVERKERINQQFDQQAYFLDSEFTDFEKFIWNTLTQDGLNSEIWDELYQKYPTEISKAYEEYYVYTYDYSIKEGRMVKHKVEGVRNPEYPEVVSDTLQLLIKQYGYNIPDLLDEYLDKYHGITRESNPKEYKAKYNKYIKPYQTTGNPLYNNR